MNRAQESEFVEFVSVNSALAADGRVARRRPRPCRGSGADVAAEATREPVDGAAFESGDGDHAETHARSDVLRRALARLSVQERAVLVLRFYDDLTEVDSAAVLGVSVGTVKSTASRALAKLRRSAAELRMEQTT